MLRKLILVALTAVFAFPTVSHAGISFGLKEKDVQEIVRKYIEDNPQIVVESFNRYQQKLEEDRQAKAREHLNTVRKELEYDPSTPVIGNPDGDVVIVEFFDYNCGYCKLMFSKVLEGTQKDGKIRWVLKDLPTLSETSTTAALAGLAANKQGKFLEMHTALMTHEGALTAEAIQEAAKNIGLDMEQYEKDIGSEEFKNILKNNRKIATEMGFNGIPQFIIGDYISQGAMLGDEMDVGVKAVRAKAAKAAEASVSETTEGK